MPGRVRWKENEITKKDAVYSDEGVPGSTVKDVKGRPFTI